MGCFLPYLFAGTGLGSQTVDRTVSASPDSAASGWTRRQQDQTGVWVQRRRRHRRDAGGGLFVRAEYEYRRVTSDVESNINTVRAGLGYKF